MNEEKYTVHTLVMDISRQFSKEETQKAKEYLNNKGNAIKTTFRIYLNLVIMTKIKKTSDHKR